MDPGRAKEVVREAVEARRHELVELSRAIHDEPELCFEETASCARVAEALNGAGLNVDVGIHDLPTALRARSGSGPLSVVVCAEYDALAAVGHACGHNIIAAAAVGAGAALAQVADDVGLSVTVLGTPAEEGGGGKILLLERGAFDGAHAAMMIHPFHEDRLTARCLAVDHFEVRYLGREAHASAAPDKGINAADAMVVAQVGIGLLRQHLPSGTQVHGIVTKGGDAPNIVPRETIGRWMVRAGDLGLLSEIRPRVQRCFEAGALATGASLEVRDLAPPYSHFEVDDGLLAAWRANAESLGRRYGADDDGKALPSISTDMANVSLAVPTIHPLIAIDAGGATIHEPAFARAAVSPSAEQAIIDGAVAMACTAIDAATNAPLRDRLLAGR